MIKNARNRMEQKAKPIERELIVEEVKTFAERCPHCGRLYKSLKNQSVKDSGGTSLAYGTCPKCGARLCKYVEADTVRVVK